VQAAPPAPHAASVLPATHFDPSQQPDGQEAAVQVQTRFWQACVEAHCVHATPFWPQAVAVMPETQVPVESQQPFGQVVELHVGAVVQTLALQYWPVLQMAQAAPPFPQACSLVPGAQLPFESQQPLGQVVALQVKAVQALLVHCWVEPHIAQALPAVPQASGWLPGWQASFEQQPVAQVDALQPAVGSLTH
jgi:hypothetical protein